MNFDLLVTFVMWLSLPTTEIYLKTYFWVLCYDLRSCFEIFLAHGNTHFHCSGFLSNLRLPSKTEFSRKIFTILNTFLTIQDFWATLRLPWKTEFALKFFTVFNILFTLRIFEELALALNSLYWIYILYRDMRWGSWLGRHCLFQSQICECINRME